MSVPTSQEPFDNATDHMTFYAFRYCLGRMTYAVGDCVQYLVINWQRIRPRTRIQIQREIEIAVNKRRIGMAIDKTEWQRILDLPTPEQVDK